MGYHPRVGAARSHGEDDLHKLRAGMMPPSAPAILRRSNPQFVAALEPRMDALAAAETESRAGDRSSD
jgi:hypothetical protein